MKEKVHKILERAQMPDGTKIQIEDWSKVYPGVYDQPFIVAYPKSKQSTVWWRKGNLFRLELDKNFDSMKEVIETFQRLLEGLVSLEELGKHYRDDRARYCMGLVDTYENPWEGVL